MKKTIVKFFVVFGLLLSVFLSTVCFADSVYADDLEMSQLYEKAFLPMADKVGVSSFATCAEFIKSLGYKDIKIVPMSKNTYGDITITGRNGNYVKLIMSGQDGGTNRLTSLEYTSASGKSSVIISDNNHKDKVTYQTVSSKGTKTVSGENDLREFLFKDKDTATKSTPSDYTVYVTKSGSKYHLLGCRHLKSKIPMSKSEAIARGYEPCSVCCP